MMGWKNSLLPWPLAGDSSAVFFMDSPAVSMIISIVALVALLFLVSCQPIQPPPPPPVAMDKGSVVVPDAAQSEAVPVDAEPQPVVFTGSSSIRLWKDLPDDYPGLDVLNLGFGGSKISDLHEQFDRVILEPRPRQVVIYSGANDISANQPATFVVANFKALVARIHNELPETRVTFISIALNPARWEQRNQVREVNTAIESFMAEDDRRQFIDVTTAMLGADGMPKPEIFTNDGLHMNRKGYALWVPLIRPALMQ